MNRAHTRWLATSGNLLFALLLSTNTLGQAVTDPAENAAEPGTTAATANFALPAEVVERLDTISAAISANSEVAEDLAARVAAADGLAREVLAVRLENNWDSILKLAVEFARVVADQRDAGFTSERYTAEARRLLRQLPANVQEAMLNLTQRFKFPDFSASVIQQAADDQEFFALIEGMLETQQSLATALELADRLQVDSTASREYLRSRLTDFAESAAVYLELARAESAGIRAALAAVPEDADLKARSRLADARLSRTASLIASNIAAMKKLDLPTAQYERQLLAVTGNISTSILNLEVLRSLISDSLTDLRQALVDEGPGFLIKAIVFMIILLVTWKASLWVQRVIDRATAASGVTVSRLLRSMLLSVSRNMVLFLGALIALSQLGISLGPLLAGLGIAGFIIGFALQDSLANFASGMLILLYKPFDLGDTIEVAGARGRVNHMTLVNTTILTFDNQTVIVPNNKIWQDVIKNVTAQSIRRVDFEFGIAYDADVEEVRALLEEIIGDDERVLAEPAPVTRLGSFGDSSVNIICRPWVKTEDYWEFYWDLNQAVKREFDARGIAIPFPQRDVHIYQHTSPE